MPTNAENKTEVKLESEIWTEAPEKILKEIGSNRERGLSSKEAEKRRQRYGVNELRKHETVKSWQILLSQFKSIIIGLLAAAAAVAFLYGEWIEGWAVLVVILINTLIGFITELRAVRAMEALYKLGTVKTRVKRDGNVIEVNAEELVPGDIVIVEGGDIVTADLRIIEASKLQADESTLTGESLPVGKSVASVAEETVLAERTNMLYKGTAVTRGSGLAVVVATGMGTELGKISSLVETTEDEETPLEERLDKLGYKLIYVTVGIIIAIVIMGVFSGKPVVLMIETGIALAVAAIPEGLPIVATISLARGLQTLARKNALVNKLSSVETLGATSVICTDKTGTLTENRMTATQIRLYNRGIRVNGKNGDVFSEGEKRLDLADQADLRLALEIGMICNNASFSVDKGKHTGDPLEIALLELGDKAGLTQKELMESHPEVKEDAFDPTVKMMATWNRTQDGQFRVNVKGAPESVLDVCTTYLEEGEAKKLEHGARSYWLDLNKQLAGQGYRMIALATKTTESVDEKTYSELCFVGLVTLMDPPRKGVKAAIADCKKAGIRVVMVTGDQAETAGYIANEIQLQDSENDPIIHGSELDSTDKEVQLRSSVFARIDPKQKLDLIDLYQQDGRIVAMTGDGVNDAPALKKADIGIAMGQRGTQVAREASDIVLTDDAFSTIVLAVEQGRVIFNNIRKFVFYLISCNVSEVMVVGIASFIGMPLPILPLQILFLNLVTDVFPALALGLGGGDRSIMEEKPRKSEEAILNRKHWQMIGGYSVIITASVLGAFMIALHWLNVKTEIAVTMSFLTLALSQLWHVFNMRDRHSGIFKNDITRNKWVWGALALCILLLLLAIYVPQLAMVLNLIPLNITEYAVVLVMSLVPLVVGQLAAYISSVYQKRAE